MRRMPEPRTESRGRATEGGGLGRAAALAFLLSALAIPGPAAVVKTQPPKPAIYPGTETDWDLHGFENRGTEVDPLYVFTNPYVPPVSNSLDHRIGLQRKLADVDPHPTITTWRVRFQLFSPEKIGAPLMKAGAGATILGGVDHSLSPAALHGNAAQGEIAHLALCDPQAAQNPTVCDGTFDCYNLHIVTGLLLDSVDGAGRPKRDVQLWSVPVEIKVDRPKTADAWISSVQVGTPVMGATIEGAPDPDLGATGTLGINTFHTPMIVGDNRLLIVRLGANARFTTDLEGIPTTGVWDSVYAYYPDGAECDVTRWTQLKPLAYAPQDPQIRPRFGFARYPMRSPSGRPVAPTQDLGGRYLWVDRAANNVFFASLSRKLLDHSSGGDLYDNTCLDGIACGSASESGALHQGWMMMGLWTHGKMVLLDSLINHTDFGLAGEEEHHRMVTLYEDQGLDVALRVGAGRDATRFRDLDTQHVVDPNPPGWIDTTVQLGSLENAFNALPHLRPGTPRDVVWLVTAGVHTDEIAFDDYISHRTLIFSPMNALKEMVGDTMTDRSYFDGFETRLRPPPPPGQLYPLEMRLQNAATTRRWDPPAFGQVVASEGTARLEHVALGGIKGRGFYLHPATGVRYSIPESPANGELPTGQWLLSLFYDLRDDPQGQVRRLITFPSGASISTHGKGRLKICPASGGCPQGPALPKRLEPGKWTHLAFHLDPGADQVHLYQDGFLFASIPRPAEMELQGGDLWLGSPDGTLPGAGGWIDELKVVEGPFSPEEVCNHARGTLVAVPHTYGSGTGVLQDLWRPFDIEDSEDPSTYREPGRLAVHRSLHGPAAQVWPLSDIYICSIDYTSPLGVSLHDPGQGDGNARSLRRRLLFPEGPIVWNHPRPSSLANPFCLSCHHAEEEPNLDLAPLSHRPGLPAFLDPRRQPFAAPATIFGRIPENHLAPDKPPLATESRNLDEWIDDGPLFRWTMDEAGGSTVPNWQIGDPGGTSTDGRRRGGTRPQPGAGRGHALRFDGLDDHVAIDSSFDVRGTTPPGQAPRQEMTIASWFQLGSAAPSICEEGGPCTLIAKAGADELWSLGISKVPSSPLWRARFSISTIGSGLNELELDLPSFDPSSWHHLAGRYDDGRLALFFDGVRLAEADLAAGALAVDPDLPVAIGARLDGLGSPRDAFEGKIDDLQIWDRALRDAEVADLYLLTP